MYGFEGYNNVDPYTAARIERERINNMYSQQNQSQLKGICRPVSSIDEAKAAMIDPLNLYIFTDMTNKRIYTKQINNMGLAEFKAYEEVAIPEPVTPQTLEEKLMARLDELEKKIEGGKNGHTKTNATTKNNEQPCSIPAANG